MRRDLIHAYVMVLVLTIGYIVGQVINHACKHTWELQSTLYSHSESGFECVGMCYETKKYYRFGQSILNYECKKCGKLKQNEIYGRVK